VTRGSAGAPTADRSIFWNGPEIGIEWPIAALLSPKDAAAPPPLRAL